MGKYFGLPNQLLMLFACLMVITLCEWSGGNVVAASSKATWSGGAPALPPMCSSGGRWQSLLFWVFPLVGLSLVIVLLLDYFVLSHPWLKAYFQLNWRYEVNDMHI